MDIIKNNPFMIMLILYACGFLVLFIKKKSIIKGLSLITMGVSTALSLQLLNHVDRNGLFIFNLGDSDSFLRIVFQIGILEAIVSVLFTFITFIILWYSVYKIENEIRAERISLYYALCNILIASLLGVVFSNDLINALIFIEISALSACGIVIVKDKEENVKAAFKYILLSSIGSSLLLIGIAIIYSLTGKFNMSLINNELLKTFSANRNSIYISQILFTIGLGIKSAMFPLHVWLPDAHSSAPASSSAILSAIVLKAYVIFYIKILYVMFGYSIVSEFSVLTIVLILGSLGMIMGSVLAITQKDIKRIIAYSSVAQISYVFFGIGLGNKLGLIASVFHIINHAAIKALLFLIVGAIVQKTGEKEVIKLKGIGKEMPITLGIFTIGALSMVGIPLLPGFISKFNFAIASVEGDKSFLVVIILLSSLLNLLYYFPIVINGYFGEENLKGKIVKSKEQTFKELLPQLTLVTGAVFLGLYSKEIIYMIEKGLTLNKFF